jgi:predicted transcriptional regulator of viral defense system
MLLNITFVEYDVTIINDYECNVLFRDLPVKKHSKIKPKRAAPMKPLRGRPATSQAYLPRLKTLGIFSQKDARAAGVPQPTLSRMVQKGSILRLARDLYRHPESDIDPAIEDFVVACAKFGPKSAIGGLSALFAYHLTDQAPRQIWILVPPGKISRTPQYRVIRTKADLGKGIESRPGYRIASVERAIAEAFRHAPKLGFETVLRAARQAIRDRRTTAEKILRQARELGFERYIIKHWESLVVE